MSTSRRAGNAEKNEKFAEAASKFVLDAIRAEPGIIMRQLVERTHLGWSTVYRAIRKLQRQGLVHTRKEGRIRRLFPDEVATPTRLALHQVNLLSNATARRIATSIAAKPGQDMSWLAAELDLGPRTVYYHLRRLRQAKLIESSREARYADLTPTAPLKEALAFVMRKSPTEVG